MTTPNGTIGDQVEGIVESVNDRGIRVGGEWRNLSKFHPLELPGQGARVRLELDNKGFIKTLQILHAAPAASGPARDRTITRLSVLKTAAAFLGQMAQVHEGVKSDHVIPLAERWLAWVEQEGGGETD
jgi:aminoglycoside phosphotransferase (APT) family kinase protein